MTRRHAIDLGILVFATLHLVVMVAPGVVLAAAAHKGGLTRFHGFDLVVASLVLGGGYAGLVAYRLRRETRRAERVADAWLASFDALVVLALTVTLLLILVLGGFAPQHAVIVNRGWPVVGLWVGVQMAGAALAELTRVRVFRWLEPAAAPAYGPSRPGDGVGADAGHFDGDRA